MADATRYPFTLAARDDAQLHTELAALALPGFLGIAGSGDAVEVLFAEPLTGAQEAAVSAVVAAHVPDPTAPLRRASQAAVMQFLASDDPTSVAIRVIARRTFTWLNDEREARGQPRRTEEEIVAQLLADATAGWGAPITIPGGG
ncbi:MAG TPA: hypothetical protein VGE74_16180 [Gemmata sp.]